MSEGRTALPKWLQEAISQLSSRELKGMRDYWAVYESHIEEVTDKLIQRARSRPDLNRFLMNTPVQDANELKISFGIPHQAIFDGKWKPYIKILREQGQHFAKAGVSFHTWHEAISILRKELVPYMLAAFGKSPKRLADALNGMQKFTDIVVSVMGESYLKTHEQLNRTQDEKLQKSEAELAAIVASTEDAVIGKTLEGIVSSWNPGAERIYGYRAAEAIGRPINFIAPPDRKQEISKFLELLRKGKKIPRTETVRITKDGRLLDISLSISPIKNKSGKIVGAATVAHDITERKKAESALRASEERYHKTLDSILEGGQIIGRDWRYLYVNDAVAKQGRMAKKDLVGHTMMEVYPGIETTEMFAALKRCMEERVPLQMENEFSYADGTSSWFELSIQPVPEGVFILSMDITSRKRIEDEMRGLNEELERRVTARTSQLKIANKELESFAYSVSHDLRAPLRTIDGFSQALLDDYKDQLPPEAQDFLNRVRGAAQRMAALIDDLLELSRITRAAVEKQPVDISALAQSIAEELQQSDLERNVKFVIAPNLKAECDSRLLRIAMVNLMNNAWKFTSKKKDAWIEIGKKQENGTSVFFVRDNGAGFDMAYADKLFGAFQRLHAVTDFPGTGVGLATVQRVIHKHGGRLRAEGAVDQGATFYFTLPGDDLTWKKR